MTTGVVAALLKLLCGARLIIEIVTTPERNYITNRPKPRFQDRLLKAYSDLCLHVTMAAADRAHFLYPDQLHAYPLLRKSLNSVFHDFVPVERIKRLRQDKKDRYILMVGAPWYLKGADLLIKAFLKLAPEFPDVNLKLLGHYPDQSGMREQIGSSTRVEILSARPNAEALKVIERALILVLPSRCEGMGRVLIEGMAAGVPLVGSRVGGIPFMIQDGENGYTFPEEDANALSEVLRQLLTSEELRSSMGDCGFARARGRFSEEEYVASFARMIEVTVHRGEPG
jgi:glycosyltransferase involved in cell wall biosynthesis